MVKNSKIEKKVLKMIYDPEDQKRLVMQNICLKNLVQRNIEDTLLSIHVVGISMGAVYKMLTN